jgi:enoyl-CoA hydratase
MSEAIELQLMDQVAIITIRREERRNALNDASLLELRSALRGGVGAGVSVTIITGAGGRAFSAGSDVKELAAQTPSERLAHTALGQSIAEEIEDHPSAVVAAIEGYCLGGGLEFALACDYRIAGMGSQFGLPEVALNALPSWGGTYRLPRLLGTARAKEMALFGRRLNASEALAWGLVAEVVTDGQALDRAIAVGQELSASTTRETLARAKALINASYGVHGHVARQLEYLADSAQTATESFDAGIAAFQATRSTGK